MEIVILAAGQGARMVSDTPKVLHTLGGLPLLEHVLRTADRLAADRVHVVTGFGAAAIKSRFASATHLNWVQQTQRLGTGHALQQVLPHLGTAANQVLVLLADVPLASEQTLRTLLSQTGADGIGLLTTVVDDAAGLGRVIRDPDGAVTGIVEDRDANPAQKAIREVNTGIMVLPAARLPDWLNRLDTRNEQSEYYLTDVIAFAVREGGTINTVPAHWLEVQGVNDKAQLALLERHYQMNRTRELLEQGVTMRDPARVDIRGTLECGRDVEIDVNVVFKGAVSLGDRVVIGPHCIISDTRIETGSTVLAGSHIDGAEVGENATIGPCARLRPGTVLQSSVRIGSFVETKNAVIGTRSKANHLAYIGDARVGEDCNIGAGVVFCNYDGVSKHFTTVGSGVFIGSNSVLIAPLKVADNAYIAAGSTINADVPADNLAVGRTKQRNIAGWKRPARAGSNADQGARSDATAPAKNHSG